MIFGSFVAWAIRFRDFFEGFTSSASSKKVVKGRIIFSKKASIHINSVFKQVIILICPEASCKMLTIFLFEETCCSMQGYASDHSSSCQFGHGHRCIGMRLRSCICCIKKCGTFLLNLLSWGCISMDVLMSWCYGINKHTFVLDLRSPNLSIQVVLQRHDALCCHNLSAK